MIKLDNFDYRNLTNFSINDKKDLACSIRNNIIECVKLNGGHLSSNLGVVELSIELLSDFDPLKDRIFFDVGHQSYPFKLLTGRSLKKLRHIDGEPPFQLKSKSNYDIYSSGHSGEGIANAIGIQLSAFDDNYTVCIIGDSSLKSGLGLESLNYISENKEKLDHLIVIINSNGMAISENNDSYSNLVRDKIKFYNNTKQEENTLNKKDISTSNYENIKVITNIDGHNFEALKNAFDLAKKISQKEPVLLNIITQKGKGLKEAEDDYIGKYHSIELKDDNSFNNLNDVKLSILKDEMKKDDNLYIITPATGYNLGLDDIFKKISNRCIDVGIKEQLAISLASGISLNDKRVIVDIYSSFIQRGIDQVIENILREKLNVTFILERASLSYGDGSSHHGIFDVGILSSLPNVNIIMPFDQSTLKLAIEQKSKNLVNFIRLPKTANYRNLNYDSYDSIYFLNKKDNKTLLLAVGPQGYEAISKIDYNVDKAILFSLNNIDFNKLLTYDTILFYDYYSTSNGTNKNIISSLFNHNFKGIFHSLTLPNEFITYGSKNELDNYLNISLDDALNFFNGYCKNYAK